MKNESKNLLIIGTEQVKKILKNKKLNELTPIEKIILRANLEVMKETYNKG